MEPLHRVTKEELPILFEWLTKYLPNSYKMHGTVYLELKGKWSGSVFHTLGWPDILAVGECAVDESESKAVVANPNYMVDHEQHNIGVISLQTLKEILMSKAGHVWACPEYMVHLETLVRRPDFLDWSKPILTHANCHLSADVLEKVSNETGTKFNSRTRTFLMVAYPGDIEPSPIPEGFQVLPLDPRLHAEYITSTWPHRRGHTETYIKALLESFHSVGLFDRNGNLVALELENEYGFSALLHVKEEVRGLGLAKCVVSLLAQKFFQENRPILAAVISTNVPAVAMHEKLGFKTIGYLDWFLHSMTAAKVMQSQ